MLQSKVMEVSQRIQPIQEKACQLFIEVEIQVALLALDQVLRNTWSYLTIFGHRHPIKDGAPGEAEIRGSRPTFGALLGFWVNVMGKGCRPMGLPMF
jgi:hypothetical protein